MHAKQLVKKDTTKSDPSCDFRRINGKEVKTKCEISVVKTCAICCIALYITWLKAVESAAKVNRGSSAINRHARRFPFDDIKSSAPLIRKIRADSLI